jgi:hypothetical protein
MLIVLTRLMAPDYPLSDLITDLQDLRQRSGLAHTTADLRASQIAPNRTNALAACQTSAAICASCSLYGTQSNLTEQNVWLRDAVGDDDYGPASTRRDTRFDTKNIHSI